MLMHAEKSVLLVIDVQEKLYQAVHESAQLVAHCDWLMRVAQTLDVPIQISEQYPRGLGLTIPRLREQVEPNHIGSKVHFSCVAGDCLRPLPASERPQVVVCGIEAHVCVLQTVLDLHEQGKSVFVVEEAISSRRASDKACAVARMRAAGVTVVSREMVLFEWAHQAGTAIFKHLSQTFLRG